MSTVLIVVDVQNDFCPGGALAVPDGDAVVPIINALARRVGHVVITQDWHPRGHVSFGSTHPGRKPFDVIELAYGTQVLWPDHCVQGSRGAELHAGLDILHAEAIVRKGCRRDVDSYSGFVEADRRTPTGLGGYLSERGATRCLVAGLATDFCVAWTALDARSKGFDVVVIENACRGIDAPTVPGGTLARAWAEMQAAGVARALSGSI